MREKRFDLKSIHFKKFTVIIYDNLAEKELHLSIYEVIELLNRVSQSEYDLRKIKKESEEINCGHCKHFQLDGMFGMWCDKSRDWMNIDAEYCSDFTR